MADCVGLFCIRQAPDDPPSLAASSMTVYNEILRRHPEWLPRLYEGYPWTRMEEEAPGEAPVSDYRVPVFSAAAGTVSCHFNAAWIRKGAERNGTPLTEQDTEMFEFIRATAAAHAFSFPLHTGDIAWMNNYTVFHGRAATTRSPTSSASACCRGSGSTCPTCARSPTKAGCATA